MGRILAMRFRITLCVALHYVRDCAPHFCAMFFAKNQQSAIAAMPIALCLQRSDCLQSRSEARCIALAKSQCGERWQNLQVLPRSAMPPKPRHALRSSTLWLWLVVIGKGGKTLKFCHALPHV